MVELLRTHVKKPVAAIGDGGNDVSMIQAANVGIGIVGKEGKQASLAADFSITKFHHVGRLFLWHGRNRLGMLVGHMMSTDRGSVKEQGEERIGR